MLTNTDRQKYDMNDYTANRNTYSSQVNGVILPSNRAEISSCMNNFTQPTHSNLLKQPINKL